jgi:uncharacterized membrane protein
VWLSVLVAGLGFWGSWSSWAPAGVFAPLLALAGVAGTAAVWLVRNPNSRVMQSVGLAITLVTVGLPQAAAIHVRQYYATDAAALNHVAARVLLHGKNPYTTSMQSASVLLKPPSAFWTYTVDGGHITQLSYPAGSFLLEVPAMALGFHHAIVDWMDLGAWLVVGALLFVMVPVTLRWFALVIALTSLLIALFSDGGTDALFIPFLILAVWRWDRFATRRGAGLAGWMGPVALGIACSIKQTPWFCIPFLVIGVALVAHRSGRNPWPVATRYLGIVVGIFVLVNLPFIIWSPVEWWNGMLLPFTHPLVADGQGIVTIALHGLTGGVRLSLLSLAGAFVYLALLVAYVLWFPVLKRSWLFLLPIVLFVPPRSLSSYLIDFFPVAIVGALTVAAPAAMQREAHSPARNWRAGLAVAAPLAVATAIGAVAFTSAPLDLAVTGFRTSNATQELDSVTVFVRNSTGHAVTPHFMVSIGASHPNGFWTTGARSPLVLGPGASTTVELRPSIYTWSPVRGGYWLVEAYTSSPNALSTSPLQFWRLGTPQ